MFKRKIKGFTLVELLVGLTLGVVVLTGLLTFFFRASKMINIEQNQVKNLSQLQFIMNRIVEDIKRANTEVPGVGTTITRNTWAGLPHLPYGRTYLNEINDPDNSLPRIAPTFPLAYNFPSQAGLSGTLPGWTPKPTGDESNQLAFYVAVDPNPKDEDLATKEVSRVIYYLEGTDIKRKEQKNIKGNSIKYDDNTLQTDIKVILSDVKLLQFTYPRLERELEDANFRAQLNDITDNIVHAQNILMNGFRDSVNIRIVTYGAVISGSKKATGLELSTEVKIRN